MKKIFNSKIGYIAMCIVFVIALVILAISSSYAFYKGQITRTNQTNTKIQTATFNVTSNLSSASAINSNDLPLIYEQEIATKSESISFNVVSTNNRTAGKLDIYLKDIAIAPELINSAFKWQLLEGSTVIQSGDFSDITTNGTASSTTNTATTNYYDAYYLKRQIVMAQTETRNFTFRVYLLDDPNANQIALANKSFSCKVAINAYSE